MAKKAATKKRALKKKKARRPAKRTSRTRTVRKAKLRRPKETISAGFIKTVELAGLDQTVSVGTLVREVNAPNDSNQEVDLFNLEEPALGGPGPGR